MLFGLNELKWSFLSGADEAAMGSMKDVGSSEPEPGWNPLGEFKFRMLRAAQDDAGSAAAIRGETRSRMLWAEKEKMVTEHRVRRSRGEGLWESEYGWSGKRVEERRSGVAGYGVDPSPQKDEAESPHTQYLRGEQGSEACGLGQRAHAQVVIPPSCIVMMPINGTVGCV